MLFYTATEQTRLEPKRHISSPITRLDETDVDRDAEVPYSRLGECTLDG